jgi:ubiquinone/menaquinone biosynthesis C-methylase UbiE
MTMGLYAKKIFPWVLDVTEPEEMAEQRRLLLKDVKGKILEIGIGTGVNLPYYPKEIKKVTGLEPSDAMRSRALRKALKAGISIDWHKGIGEKLPFDEACFDIVVLVDVLCSVSDVDAVLRESFRVLKAGGRLHFLEHGISGDKKIRKWQMRLNGLSKIVACGCQLTRNVEKHLVDSRFHIDELITVPPFKGVNALYTHVRGIATKPL